MFFDQYDRHTKNKPNTGFFLHPSILLLGCLLVICACWSQFAYSRSLQLSASETVSTAGYFSLNWHFNESIVNDPGGADYILQKSTNPDFAAYQQWQIHDATSFAMSGLESGNYYFRVGNHPNGEQWSNTVRVEVSHHSLAKAFALFLLGACLFVALLVVILVNRKAEYREDYHG